MMILYSHINLLMSGNWNNLCRGVQGLTVVSKGFPLLMLDLDSLGLQINTYPYEESPEEEA